MKHERKQLICAQFIKKLNKMAYFASCYLMITSFQKHESQFSRNWGSFLELWRTMKKFSYLLSHWNQASALGNDKTWALLNDETWSTQSFNTGRNTTGWWFTFLFKDVGTGTIVLRPVEVYFSVNTVTNWLRLTSSISAQVYHLPVPLQTIRHLLSTQLSSTETTHCKRHIHIQWISVLWINNIPAKPTCKGGHQTQQSLNTRWSTRGNIISFEFENSEAMWKKKRKITFPHLLFLLFLLQLYLVLSVCLKQWRLLFTISPFKTTSVNFLLAEDFLLFQNTSYCFFSFFPAISILVILKSCSKGTFYISYWFVNSSKHMLCYFYI